MHLVNQVNAALLSEGIRWMPEENRFSFDFAHDGVDDIIKLCPPKTRGPNAKTPIRIYRAYKFENDVPQDVRTAFKEAAKMLTVGPVVHRMIKHAVNHVEGGFSYRRCVDLIITVTSSGPLVELLAEAVHARCPEAKIVSGGVIKKTVKDIKDLKVDFDLLTRSAPKDYTPDQVIKMVGDAEKNIGKAIKGGKFKMRGVLTNFRRYVSGFMDLSDDVLGVMDMIEKARARRVAGS